MEYQSFPFQTSDGNGFRCEVDGTAFSDSLDECCFLLCVRAHTHTHEYQE